MILKTTRVCVCAKELLVGQARNTTPPVVRYQKAFESDFGACRGLERVLKLLSNPRNYRNNFLLQTLVCTKPFQKGSERYLSHAPCGTMLCGVSQTIPAIPPPTQKCLIALQGL